MRTCVCLFDSLAFFSFSRQLLKFDKSAIPKETIDKVAKYIDMADFVPEKVAKASQAARGPALSHAHTHTHTLSLSLSLFNSSYICNWNHGC